MPRPLLRLSLISLAAFLTGCSSVADVADEQRIYGGVRRVVEGRAPLKGGGSLGGASAEGIDFVFSAVLDTLLLPFTITYTLLRSTSRNSGSE